MDLYIFNQFEVLCSREILAQLKDIKLDVSVFLQKLNLYKNQIPKIKTLRLAKLNTLSKAKSDKCISSENYGFSSTL